MSTPGYDKQTHRTWIRQARIQSDEAERKLADAGLSARPDETTLQAHVLPGYRLEREIHRGGQGTVYRAVQTSTGRRVAVKLLHNHAFGGPLERARFERETRVLAALHHPNIVTIHDGGSRDGRFFLVMDYIAGQPLDVYMASQPRPIKETLGLFVQICDAINAAHVRGIIHRDLKPANVRVDVEGRPFVLDFGLAKFTVPPLNGDGLMAQPMHDMTMTGQFLGSLPWAAPEQADGSPSRIDTRTDVYALGVMLFQMLTNRFPYPVVGNVRSVLDNIANMEPVRPRTLCREIDDELETIVLKCLSKERERRYQTAGELARDVRRYIQGDPIEAKRDSALYLLRKTVRRYWIPLGVIALFGMLLAGSTIVAWTLSVQARKASADAKRAEDTARRSEETAREALRDSLIAQARATRRTARIGQRFSALEALAKAAAIGPTADARNEAIAAMALPDLRIRHRLRQPGLAFFDGAMERCACMDDAGAAVIVNVSDEQEIARIPAPEGGVEELHAATVSGRHFLRLYDPPTGNRRLEIWTIPDARLHLALTDVPFQARYDIAPDGRTLAIGRLDKAIHFIDLETGRDLKQIQLDRNPAYVKFDPTGRRLALFHGAYAKAQLLDIETEKMEPAFSSPSIGWSVSWRPDGRRVAASAVNQIEIWDVAARRLAGVLTGHNAQVIWLSYSRDGNLLFSHDWDGETILWDPRSMRLLLRLPLSRPCISDDGRFIGGSISDDKGLHPTILELCSAPERRLLIGEGDLDTLVAGHGRFIPDTNLLIVTSLSAPEHSGMSAWDVVCGREVMLDPGLGHGALAVGSRGGSLFMVERNGVIRWAIQRNELSLSLIRPERITDNIPSAIDVSADGRRVVISGYKDGEFSVIDSNAPDKYRRVPCLIRGDSRIRISPDGRWAAYAGWHWSHGEVWDLDNAARVIELRPSYSGRVAFSPDGQRLVHADRDGLSTWNVADWKLINEVPGSFSLVQFSPDSRLIVTTPTPTALRLMDANTLAELAQLEPPESFSSADLTFDSDGSMLAQMTNRNGVAHVWNLRAIREQLAAIGLDWDQPPFPAAHEGDAKPFTISIDRGETPLQ